MPLFDHLAEFRSRLTIVVVSLIGAAIVVYFATPTLISIMLDPNRRVLPEGSELTVISALGGFSIRFKVAIFFGAIMCTPIILWEVLGFFLPALTEKERK
jgi:sec-independent protein translocase protein TatC